MLRVLKVYPLEILYLLFNFAHCPRILFFIVCLTFLCFPLLLCQLFCLCSEFIENWTISIYNSSLIRSSGKFHVCRITCFVEVSLYRLLPSCSYTCCYPFDLWHRVIVSSYHNATLAWHTYASFCIPLISFSRE